MKPSRIQTFVAVLLYVLLCLVTLVLLPPAPVVSVVIFTIPLIFSALYFDMRTNRAVFLAFAIDMVVLGYKFRHLEFFVWMILPLIITEIATFEMLARTATKKCGIRTPEC